VRRSVGLTLNKLRANTERDTLRRLEKRRGGA